VVTAAQAPLDRSRRPRPGPLTAEGRSRAPGAAPPRAPPGSGPPRSARSGGSAQIAAFNDPACTWCWGSEPVLRAVEARFGGSPWRPRLPGVPLRGRPPDDGPREPALLGFHEVPDMVSGGKLVETIPEKTVEAIAGSSSASAPLGPFASVFDPCRGGFDSRRLHSQARGDAGFFFGRLADGAPGRPPSARRCWLPSGHRRALICRTARPVGPVTDRVDRSNAAVRAGIVYAPTAATRLRVVSAAGPGSEPASGSGRSSA
jgi:hypothetical protein